MAYRAFDAWKPLSAGDGSVNPNHEDAPECQFCGDTRSELRWYGWATRTKPCDLICEDCYCDPSTDEAAGPAFDDLPLAANPYRGLEHTTSYREDKL